MPDLADGVTVEEIANAALGYVWDGCGEGDALRAICRRLGGRYAAEVDLVDRERMRAEDAARIRREAERAYRAAVLLLRPVVFSRDGHRCLRCGSTSDLTVDHIVPRSKGGPTVLENLQTLCRGCNSRKGTR